MGVPATKLLPPILAVILLLATVACNGEQPAEDIEPTANPANSESSRQLIFNPTATPTLPAPAKVSPNTSPPPAGDTEPTSTPPATDITPEAELFQDTPCPNFGVPAGPDFRCGFFSVAENRQKPKSDHIRLAVMVARGIGDEVKPDPVVYLSGGPGENAIESMRFLFIRHFIAFTGNRDLIVLDQRGTGLSEPALDCPELLELRDETAGQDLGNEESVAMAAEAIAGCRKRLLDEGVDLGAYTSAASAADVTELMNDLGYDRWNLYGISYGTKLALTIMRDYPEGVRSAILDSAYPLQEDLYGSAPANLDRALTVLFEGCRASEECEANYPALENVLMGSVSALNAEPVSLRLTNPLTGRGLEPLFDGNGLLHFLFQSLYDTDVIPSLPKIIFDIEDGRMGTVELILSSRLIADQLFSPGMQLSVQCGEEVPFTSVQTIRSASEKFPKLAGMFEGLPALGPAVVQICDDWGVPAAGLKENEQVSSDIPTLVMSGEFDPVTPPSWGMRVRDDLPNSTFIEFPGTGHGASVDNTCALDIMMQFLGDPDASLDESCLADLTGPAFEVPASEISLVPVFDPTFGSSAMAPEGWQIIAPGMYGQTALGETALIMQSVPGLDENGFLALMAGQLNLTEPPQSRGTFEGVAFTWSLYGTTAQGLTVDVALSESADAVYIVILQTTPDQRDFLLQEVFEPVVMALTPSP